MTYLPEMPESQLLDSPRRPLPKEVLGLAFRKMPGGHQTPNGSRERASAKKHGSRGLET